MNDQEIMENLLMTAKGVCDLYMHGAIESATQDVHQAFGAALTDSLSMQDSIYKQMQSKGWYPTDTAEQQKLDQVRQKFCGSI